MEKPEKITGPVKDEILVLDSIEKSFSGVSVLHGVNFRLYRGELLALVGENGAGKSTLMKITSGVYPHSSFSGKLIVDGSEMHFSSVKDSEAAGISIIHQELNLVGELRVYENIFLGSEITKNGILKKKTMMEKAKDVLSSLGIDINPMAFVEELTVGQMQMVEIAKAVSKKSKILIMDEPTSALTDRETEHLFGLIENLRKSGISIVYISHKLEEVFRISDRIVVLRDGSVVGEVNTPSTSTEEIISMMVGRKLSQIYPPRIKSSGPEFLKITDYSVFSNGGSKILDNINFAVKEGEIFGIAGLMGSGRSLLLHSVFGSTKLNIKGEISLQNKSYHPKNISYAVAFGFAFVPEDRKLLGLILDLSVRHNMYLPMLTNSEKSVFIDKFREESLVNEYIESLNIKCASKDINVNFLSGGNQQKVVIGKWMCMHPKVFMLDEPTRGVDVGAKLEIYHLLNKLVSKKQTIIIASSDLPELLGISHRIGVMSGGKMVKIADAEKTNQEEIMHYATGGK